NQSRRAAVVIKSNDTSYKTTAERSHDGFRRRHCKLPFTLCLEASLTPDWLAWTWDRERQTRPGRRLRPRRRGWARADRAASGRPADGRLVGIPRRQGRGERNAGSDRDPGAAGGT